MKKIKLCGLTRPCDIEAANLCRPDYIGFVFAESRRQVSVSTARALRAQLAPGILPVGVFVRERPEVIAGLLEEGVIELAQLHGGESEDDILRLRALTDKPIIRAVRVSCAEDIQKVSKTAADFLLLDSGGGSGKVFPWELIGRPEKPFFLAGGLSEENLSAALRTGAYALDLSSGIETEGKKDAEKMRRIVTRVREEIS